MIRTLPLVTACVYIGYLVIWRAWRFRARHGRSPIHIPARNDFSLHAMLSRALVLYFFALIGLAAAAAGWPGALAQIDPFFAPGSPGLTLAGFAVVVGSAWLVRRAQDDMAASWRIGVDPGERTDLVTGKTFRFCRNPIYLGLMLALAGFTLMIPGAAMATLTASAVVLFNLQARLEERYLLRVHGEDFRRFCREVGRFLPGTGHEIGP